MRASYGVHVRRLQARGPQLRDKFSWVWLIAGAALLPFSSFQTVLPLAAWLAPLFLLRFVRTQRAAISLPVLALVYYLATSVAMRGFFEPPLGYLLGLGGVVSVACYAADAVLAPRLRGVARTLVFPLSVTVLDWLMGMTPIGSGGAVAYSQYGNLPLMQLAALTGVWGVSFLVAWFAPVANDLWEHAAAWRAAWPRLGLYAGVLMAVLLFGSARLAFVPSGTPTVRVAALAADKALWHSLTLGAIDVAQGTATTRQQARGEYQPIWQELMARTRTQARAGAQIVAWSEAAVFVLKEDEAAWLDEARALAQAEGIYLQLALVVVLATDQYPYAENRAILIDPSGAVVWDYFKTVHPFGDNAVFAPGDGSIPVAQTPYGRLATVICFDADFPALLRQVGKGQAGLLLAPSNDWPAVAVMHTRVHVWRAIESGVTLVRPTGNGIALAVDPLGRVLGEADYAATDRLTLVADVPAQGRATLYTRIGDAFAYLCLAGLAGVAAAAWRRGRRDIAPVVPAPVQA
jgi:apolipoprotein N-acyltransferase